MNLAMGILVGYLSFVVLWAIVFATAFFYDKRQAFKETQRDSKAEHTRTFSVESLTPEELHRLDKAAEEEDYYEDMGFFATEIADPVVIESTLAWVLADAQLQQRPDEEIQRMRDEWEGMAA